MTEPTVGFIGLGQIGAPMATRLIGRDGGLVVFDVHAPATEPFAAAGAVVATTPAEVAERATVISLMVQNDAQVTDVVAGSDGLLTTAAAGTVIAIHSTVEADTPSRIAALAAPHGVHVVDAPVSGGFMGAHEGNLAFMVGGDDDAVAIIREAFEPMAGLVAHLGPIGAGTRAKLARNLITFASFTAVGEALRLAEAAGVDLAKLGDVVRHSDKITGGPGAIMLGQAAGSLPDGDGLRSIFEHTRTLGEKDLALALDLAASLGVDAPVAAQAHALLAAALGVPHNT
jgi:3-hydroxyisobutyrate dehydrogenase